MPRQTTSSLDAVHADTMLARVLYIGAALVVSSKEKDYFFNRLLRWEKTASLNAAFCALLEQDFRVAFSSVKTHPAQELTALSLVGAAYQHFGFAVFGPMGRALVVSQIVSLSGLNPSALSQWLELVAYSLLEDLNVLQVVSGEPDWCQVDLSFSMELWKRLFCSDENEASSLGLDCLDGQEISRLRKLAAKAVSLMGSSVLDASSQAALPLQEDLSESHASSFRAVAASASANPIMLLLWRIEVFSLLKETRHEYKFRLKVEVDDLLPTLSALAGVLMVLSPVADDTGIPLFPESPLNIEEIEHELGMRQLRGSAAGSVVGGTAHSKVLRQWVGDDCSSIDQILALGCSYGLIFSVSLRPGKLAYGLTAKGTQTLAPFLSILGELLCPSIVSPQVSPVPVSSDQNVSASTAPKKRSVSSALPSRARGKADTSAQSKMKKSKAESANKATSQREHASSGADGFMNELSEDLGQARPRGVGASKNPRTAKAKPGARQ